MYVLEDVVADIPYKDAFSINTTPESHREFTMRDMTLGRDAIQN